MTAGMFMDCAEEDEWIADADLKSSFKDPHGSPMLGSIEVPAPDYLNSNGALSLIESADRLIAWATAIKLRALARFEESLTEEPLPHRDGQPPRFGPDLVHTLAVAEVATTGAISETTAARLLGEAADLSTTIPAVLDALESREISPAHAKAILDQSRTIAPQHAPAFARTALQHAPTRTGRRRTPAELRACLRRLREQLHPETIEARKAAARPRRGLWFAPEPDGMCTLTAYLPAETGLAIYNGLDRDARHAASRDAASRHAQPGTGPQPGPGTAREAHTLSVLRADALAHRLLGTGTETEPAPFVPEVTITIPLELALDAGTGTAGPDGTSAARPAAFLARAELEGYGPIDAPTARRLASLAPTWHRLFTDARTGAALGVGRTAYRPPRALRRYLAHRDGTCRFPGCTRLAAACEPDHTIEWQDGGTTDLHNLALLCRKHHALKSIDAWAYHHAPDGTLTWQSQHGRIHTSEPAHHSPRPEPLPPSYPRPNPSPRDPSPPGTSPPGSNSPRSSPPGPTDRPDGPNTADLTEQPSPADPCHPADRPPPF